jgi:hypothetical protein
MLKLSMVYVLLYKISLPSCGVLWQSAKLGMQILTGDAEEKFIKIIRATTAAIVCREEGEERRTCRSRPLNDMHKQSRVSGR